MSFSVARSCRTFSIVFFWQMLLFALLKSAVNFLYFLISLFKWELSSESWRAFCLNLYSIPRQTCALIEKTFKRNFWDLHVMFFIESFIQTPLSYFSHSLESWLYKVTSLNWSRRISADPLSPLETILWRTLSVSEGYWSPLVPVIIFKIFSLSLVLMIDSTVLILSSSDSGLELVLFHLVVS